MPSAEITREEIKEKPRAEQNYCKNAGCEEGICVHYCPNVEVESF